jgi:hypothetical protein
LNHSCISTALTFRRRQGHHPRIATRSSLTRLMPHSATLLHSPSPCRGMWAKRPQVLFRAPTIAFNTIPRRSCIAHPLVGSRGLFHLPSLIYPHYLAHCIHKICSSHQNIKCTRHEQRFVPRRHSSSLSCCPMSMSTICQNVMRPKSSK